jgi:hypothetical protein
MRRSANGYTRREAVRRVAVLGLAGGAGGAVLGADGAAGAERDLLVPLVGTESLGIFVYEQALDAKVLSPRGDRLAQRLLDQEHQHAERLVAELQRLGGTPPTPISSASDANRVLAAHRVPDSLAALRNEHDTIILLARIEWLLEGAYYAAVAKLTQPRLLRLCAQVMANEAQHGTMLSELLHPGDVDKAVPSSYVLGTRWS